MISKLTSATDDQEEENERSDTLATLHPNRKHLLRRRRWQLPGLSTLLLPVVLLSHKSGGFAPKEKVKVFIPEKIKNPVLNTRCCFVCQIVRYTIGATCSAESASTVEQLLGAERSSERLIKVWRGLRLHLAETSSFPGGVE